jgi:hypothetical protein
MPASRANVADGARLCHRENAERGRLRPGRAYAGRLAIAGEAAAGEDRGAEGRQGRQADRERGEDQLRDAHEVGPVAPFTFYTTAARGHPESRAAPASAVTISAVTDQPAQAIRR